MLKYITRITPTSHGESSMRDCGFDMFTFLFTFCSWRHLVGHFWAEMEGQQTGLNGKEIKLAYLLATKDFK